MQSDQSAAHSSAKRPQKFNDLALTILASEPADQRLRSEFDAAIAAANAGIERASAVLRAELGR